MTQATSQIYSFGDSRKMMLDAAASVLSGDVEVSRAVAFAAIMKEVNGSIQVEVNQAKAVVMCQQAGHDFGRIVRMGKKKIGGTDDGED